MNRKLILVLVLPILAMLMISEAPAVSAAVVVPNPDKYTYLTTGGPETADPAWAYDTASAELIFNVYNCLLDFDFVDLSSYVPELAEWWPGYGTVAGNVLQPQPVAPHTYTNTSAVNPSSPVGSTWTRKGITYTLTAAPGGLVVGQSLTMTWTYDTIGPGGQESIKYTILKIEGTYTLTLRPIQSSYYSVRDKAIRTMDYVQTWYFKIRTGVQWQDPTYGTVTPYDIEYSIERGMVMDHSGGPQWMFYQPLTGQLGSRAGFNIKTYKYYNASKTSEEGVLGRIIDDAIESNSTYVWFNLAMPYAAFQQILAQSWGSVMDPDWVEAQGCWNASWHKIPGEYKNWIKFNNPPAPGPIGYKMMGCGPYYLDYIEADGSMHRLKSFANYWGGWSKPHCDTIVHEIVMEWADRKLRFLSDDPATQADQVTVLRADVNDPDLLAAIAAGKVRYLPHLPTLSADAIFFAYDYTDTNWHNGIGDGAGGYTTKTNLLSDRDLRLALIYAYNVTEVIDDVMLGEAAPLHDPVIYGIAYANATKHATMHYDKDMAKLVQHLQTAWGGEVWTKGFKVTIVCGPDVSTRRVPAEVIKDTIELELPDYLATHGIDRPLGAVDSVVVVGQDWGTFITNMYSEVLPAFVVGWLADFPDPHNWVVPFMDIYGDFSYFQHITYGLGTMNWHPQGSYGQSGLPYYNYNGDLVTEINNDYIEDLIYTGIGLTDPAVRERLYNELEDIYYAEAPSIMTFQPEGRHYERQWVHGWFYNSIYPGLMFYGEENLWKKDPATVTRDLAIIQSATAKYLGPPLSNGWEVTFDKTIINQGENPEKYLLTCEVSTATEIVTCTKEGWIYPGSTVELKCVVWHSNLANAKITAKIEISPDWVPKIQEANTANNIKVQKVAGDLGYITVKPPPFYDFDGHCNYKDVNLFSIAFSGYHELADFNKDGVINYVDAGPLYFRKYYLESP